MTKEQLAQALNGCEYRNEVSDELAQVAKESGLIIIYGASDDLCEITGLNDTELSSYRGGDFVLFNDGRAFMVKHSSDILEEHDEETYDLYRQAFKAGQIVTAQWCEVEDYGWTYKTDIPHASFEIMDDGDKMGMGIVIQAATLQYPSQVVAEGSGEYNPSNQEKLVALLRELGYGRGKQLDVALLGLAGEAGEVLNEVPMYSIFKSNTEEVSDFIHHAAKVDNLKKLIRRGDLDGPVFTLTGDKREVFKTELADLFYYITATCLETGVTLEELAHISHDKVRGKMATPTGSSEQIIGHKGVLPEPYLYKDQPETISDEKAMAMFNHMNRNTRTVGNIIKEEFVPEWDKINAERASELFKGVQNYQPETNLLTADRVNEIIQASKKEGLLQTDEISDGYHTFKELYDHRIELYIQLCYIVYGIAKFAGQSAVWRAQKHSDGSLQVGWFILGIGDKPGEQISYHLPIERWDDCSFAMSVEKAPEWDGHTPADVLDRLKKMR